MNRIKHCREKSNLSQKYVAVALGVAAPSVSNWESGKTKPSMDNYVIWQNFSVFPSNIC